MDIFKIKLGEKVKDSITGFEGTVVARTEYLNGCVQYQLEGKEPTEPGKEIWLDEQRLVEKGIDVISCSECGKLCKGERGLRVHKSRSHSSSVRYIGGGRRSHP